MNVLQQLLKNWTKKAGYTVLKGDLRTAIATECTAVVLPQSLVSGAVVYASRLDVLPHLPKGGVITEIGVGYGDFSEVLVQHLQPQKFIAIDSFGFSAGTEPWRQTRLATSGLTHEEWYKQRMAVFEEKNVVEIRKGMSWNCIAQLPNESLDFAYVDADHSYASVMKDGHALISKMKKGGLIQFNDYTFFDYNALQPFGVPKAVHELMMQYNLRMQYLCLHPEGFYDVGVVVS